MKIAVQKNHLVGQILYTNLVLSKKRRLLWCLSLLRLRDPDEWRFGDLRLLLCCSLRTLLGSVTVPPSIC